MRHPPPTMSSVASHWQASSPWSPAPPRDWGWRPPACSLQRGRKCCWSPATRRSCRPWRQDLRKQQPGAQLHTQCMDLADLDSVRAAVAQILQRHPRIHLLINNAGVMACPLARTAQGFEMQFGTNHMGHFLFTCLLAPALLAGGAGPGGQSQFRRATGSPTSILTIRPTMIAITTSGRPTENPKPPISCLPLPWTSACAIAACAPLPCTRASS